MRGGAVTLDAYDALVLFVICVSATAMTLLVLEFKVPQIVTSGADANGQLLQSLLRLWPLRSGATPEHLRFPCVLQSCCRRSWRTAAFSVEWNR